MVAEYVITAAARRMPPVVLDVLLRYPRAPEGRSRVAILMARLDAMVRDPAPFTMMLGQSSAAIILEVGYVEGDAAVVIIHAMRARKRFLQ